MSCSKTPTTWQEQLDLFKARGLQIDDETFALHCLKHHNYYRLSAYRFALALDNDPDQFQEGVTFDDLWGLYCFDRQLRLLVMEAVKRLEISVRSHWAYILAHARGPQAYENASNFHDVQRHTKALAALDHELGRSHEVFVGHFQSKYGMVRPPVWAACEVMSFGLLSRFYENYKRIGDRKKIAWAFGLYPETLKSLLEHATYVRNLCAHHSRLWNRRFTITMVMPKHPRKVEESLNPEEGRRIYNTLVVLAHIVDVVEPENHWAHRLLALLRAQTSDVTSHMGFPEDWETRPVWTGRSRGQ